MFRHAPQLGPRSFATLTALATLPGLSYARSGRTPVPANAQVRPYGVGGECDTHYRASNGVCVPSQVPANAYTTNLSPGRGWDCR